VAKLGFFGWEYKAKDSDLSDEEILEKLLALNLERASMQNNKRR
jgi:hypothetical protein